MAAEEEPSGRAVKPEPPTPDRQGIAMLGGREVHYEYFGKGDREAVCLMNGLAMDCASWYSTLPALQGDYDVVLYDYFGQGRSTTRDEPCGIDELADSLAAVLDALGLEKIHTMGVSYGGFVAAEFSRLHSQRLFTQTLSGILVRRSTCFRMYQDLSLRFYRGGPEAWSLYTHYLYEKIWGQTALDRVFDPILETLRARFEERFGDKIFALIRLTEAQDPFFDRIDADPGCWSRVRTPTLLLSGGTDRVIPLFMQQTVKEAFADVRQILMPGVGHMTYLEDAAFFWSVQKAFMRAKRTDFAVPEAQAEKAAHPAPWLG